MIILVGGIKGGSGKSTIATNLSVIRALKKNKVLLVDADSQCSSSDFTSIRNEYQTERVSYTCIQLQDMQVRTEIQKLQNNYDDVIIDTGGRDTNSQRAGLIIADMMIIPFAPRSFDMWTISKVNQLIEEIKIVNDSLKVFAFINKADPSGRDNEEAKNLLKEEKNIELINPFIGNRKIFGNAISQGLSVIEYNPRDIKAEKEIQQLYNYIFNI